MSSPNRRRLPLVLLVLAAVGAGAWWYLEKSTRPPSPDGPPSTRLVHEEPAVRRSLGHDATPPREEVPSSTPASSAQAEAAGTLTAGDILAEPDEDLVRVAKKLRALVANPAAPMVEREEALSHTLNLAAGNEREVILPMIKDPNVPDELAQTILAEALNSSLHYQADLYLDALVARQSPELREIITDHLTFLTDGKSFGTDVDAWRKALKEEAESWPE